MGLKSPERLKQINQIARAEYSKKLEHALKWATAQTTVWQKRLQADYHCFTKN
jgi:hypothetical protein